MLVADSYPFLEIFWTMLIFFAWVAWFMLLFRVIGDIFRRHDIGGGGKALWMIFVIIVPFLGVFIYLIAENQGMTERTSSRRRPAGSSSTTTCGSRRQRRRRGGDREGEAAAGQRRDHAGRVRRAEGESAWVSHWPSRRRTRRRDACARGGAGSDVGRVGAGRSDM